MNMKKDFLSNYKYGVTHGGCMHSDEVFAAAFLKMINPYFKILREQDRSEEINYNSDVLVFDMGNSYYNHHNEYLKYRENGSKFASFGLILYSFGHELGLSDEDIKYLDEKFVEAMDISDNDGNINDYSIMIDRFNTSCYNVDYSNKRFYDAVKLAKTILEKEIYNLKNNINNNNTYQDIENVYIDAFLGLIDDKLNHKNCRKSSLLGVYESYAKDILNFNEVTVMKQKIARYQKIFNLKKEESGFVQVVKLYDLNNQFERRDIKNIVQKFLLRDIIRNKCDVDSEDLIKKIYLKATDNYIILPKAGLSWTKTVTMLNNSKQSKNIDYVIFETLTNNVIIKCVPKNFSNKTVLRNPFPESWRGKNKEELMKIHESLSFCHSTGFLCTVKTIEDAISILKLLSNDIK